MEFFHIYGPFFIYMDIFHTYMDVWFYFILIQYEITSDLSLFFYLSHSLFFSLIFSPNFCHDFWPLEWPNTLGIHFPCSFLSWIWNPIPNMRKFLKFLKWFLRNLIYLSIGIWYFRPNFDHVPWTLLDIIRYSYPRHWLTDWLTDWLILWRC